MSTTPGAGAAGTWRLGDLTVNRLGLGAMRLTGTEPFHRGEPLDRDRAIAVLRRARELGVDHVDTAAFYFSRTRSANELIGAALAPYDDDLVIVTKVGPSRDADGAWAPWARPDQLRGQVEDNLRTLGRDHLDVVNYRAADDSAGTDVSEHVGALAELVTAGLVRHVGVSGVGVEQLDQACAVTDVVCVQDRFSVDDPGARAVLERCGELGIAFVPFFALAQAGPALATTVAEVAAEVGASPAQVRLAWTLHLGPHVLAIPGTGDPAHVDANVAAAALRLGEEHLRRLGAAAAPDPAARS